jgi:hypothetical protein
MKYRVYNTKDVFDTQLLKKAIGILLQIHRNKRHQRKTFIVKCLYS